MKNLTVALLGDPISHSLSPIIYPRLGRAAGVNVTYLAYTVKKEEAVHFLARLYNDGVDAVNLTSPLKTLFGGHNLIVNALEGNKVWNTDAEAFRWSYAKYLMGKKTALIIGTGGVVTGVSEVLQDMGLSVTVAGRSMTRPGHISHGVAYACIDSRWNLAEGMDAVIWAIPTEYEKGPALFLSPDTETVFIDLNYRNQEHLWFFKPGAYHNGLMMVIQNAVLALDKINGPLDQAVRDEALCLYNELQGSL